MATRGIRGQSVASQWRGVVLFGGFDDHIVRVDTLTGRLTKVDTAGRTILFPWDDSHFVCVEEALGRPSKTRLTLRPYSAPAEVAAVDGEWATTRRLIPGHYPSVFFLESGRLEVQDVPHPSDDHATRGFLAGVYADEVPELVDGAWSKADGVVLAGPGVGRDHSIYLATADSFVVATDGAISSTTPMTKAWRPAVVEHDPIAGQVMVASWNRWGSLGGPSSDIHVFDEAGSHIGSGRINVLVERMAIDGRGVMTMDLEDRPGFVELGAVAG